MTTSWEPGDQARVRPEGAQRWMRGEVVEVRRIGEALWNGTTMVWCSIAGGHAWEMPDDDLVPVDQPIPGAAALTAEDIAEAVDAVKARRLAALRPPA